MSERLIAGDGWSYIQTDDHEAPCVLDCQWEELDDPYAGPARPYWPDGSTVERVYFSAHDKCQAAAIAYTSEAGL